MNLEKSDLNQLLSINTKNGIRVLLLHGGSGIKTGGAHIFFKKNATDGRCLLCWVPLPPGDGEDSGDAPSDAARFHSTPLSPETQEEMEAEPAPPPTAGSSTDGVLQRRRWKQDTTASEDRLVVRMVQNAILNALEPAEP